MSTPPPPSDAAKITEAAKALAGAAFTKLREVNVVPPSKYQPHLQVGRDYQGSDVDIPEFAQLCELLDAAFPDRFSAAPGTFPGDYASHWAYSFIEACIARCSHNDETFEAAAAGVQESIVELFTTLGSPDAMVAVCRLVSHVTTSGGVPVDLHGVRVVPAGFQGGIHEEISRHIPGGYGAFARDSPRPMASPLSVLTIQDHGSDRYRIASELTTHIDRFLLVIRLLYASTSQSIYEISGETTLLSQFKPRSVVFNGSLALVQRTVRLSPNNEHAIAGLNKLISTVNRRPYGMLATSFEMALGKFARSFQSGNWDEQIVDLTTALEGALSGSSTTDILLRIETRAAVLLAEVNDPAESIFNDIKHLYDLRSKLVHGSSFRESELRKRNRAISTVPENMPAGTAAAYMVDRLRDLVRRAILMRICLACEPATLWPIHSDEGVDAKLTDDIIRAVWRSRWHERLAEIGAEDAANPAREAGEFFSPEELRQRTSAASTSV